MKSSLALLGAAVVLLAACSNPPSDSPEPTIVGQPSAETPVAPETIEEVFAVIADLGLDDRAIDAYLLERARSEGSITMYLNTGSGNLEDVAQAWSDAFAETYPGVGMQFVSIDVSDFNTRVIGEHRAGRPQADVLRTSATLLSELEREGLLAQHFGVLKSEGVPEWTVSQTMVIARMAVSAIAWNTARTSAGEQPQTWDDFLAPAHAGCTLGPQPSWVVGMLAQRGLEGTEEWFERFISNGGVMTLDSGAAALRKLVSGEIDCVVHVTSQAAETQRLAGAPVDWSIPENSPATTTSFSILGTTEKPHSAALFVRWALSQTGARIAADFGELAVRLDVEADAERLRPLQDRNSDVFRRILVIDSQVAAQFDQQASDILAMYHTPNIIQR